MTTSFDRCQRGFTLTEVLVSLTIFLITSLGLLPLLLTGTAVGSPLGGQADRLAQRDWVE